MKFASLSLPGFRRHRRDQPILITQAEPSLNDQLARRRRRYIFTMSLRVVLLVLAALFFRIPWLMAIFAVTALVMPWIAVIMANDRPAPKGEKVNRYTAEQDRKKLPPSAGSPLAQHPDPALNTPLLEDHHFTENEPNDKSS